MYIMYLRMGNIYLLIFQIESLNLLKSLKFKVKD